MGLLWNASFLPQQLSAIEKFQTEQPISNMFCLIKSLFYPE